MDSKSSAENVATSGAKGNTEDITQLENPSVAGPSGIKAKDIPRIVTYKSCAADNLKESSEILEDHVNVGLGNGSGDSDNEVLNEPEDNGSTYPSREENLTDPADTIKAAHEAAKRAREAAASCRKTLHNSHKFIKFCNKSSYSSARKARAVARKSEASRYRSLARKYQMVTQCIEGLISEAENFAELADVTADNADDCATKLAEVVDIAPGSLGDRQKLTTAAIRTAKSAALDAYKGKYLLLNGVKQSWENIETMEIRCTESTISFSDERTCMKIGINVFAIIMAVVGIVFLTSPYYTKLNKQSYDALTAIGSIMLVMSSLIILYRFARSIYKQRKTRERKRRRKMAASIEAELRFLKDYIEKNDMTASLVMAGSQDEN